MVLPTFSSIVVVQKSKTSFKYCASTIILTVFSHLSTMKTRKIGWFVTWHISQICISQLGKYYISHITFHRWWLDWIISITSIFLTYLELMLVLQKNDISAVVENLFDPVIHLFLCQRIYKSVTSSSDSVFPFRLLFYHKFIIYLWQK